MYYTGVDLHRRTSYLTTVDQRGKAVAGANLPNDKRGGPSRLRRDQSLGYLALLRNLKKAEGRLQSPPSRQTK